MKRAMAMVARAMATSRVVDDGNGDGNSNGDGNESGG